MTTKPDITQEELKRLVSYDPDTGLFIRLQKTSRAMIVGVPFAGGKKEGRLRLAVLAKSYLAHRLAWFWMTGEWPADHIDHINGDATDNRWSNLRSVTHAENQQNKRRPSRDNRCGFLGVSMNRKKFSARICVNRTTHRLGNFETPEQAHAAYVEAKRKLHSMCTL